MAEHGTVGHTTAPNSTARAQPGSSAQLPPHTFHYSGSLCSKKTETCSPAAIPWHPDHSMWAGGAVGQEKLCTEGMEGVAAHRSLGCTEAALLPFSGCRKGTRGQCSCSSHLACTHLLQHSQGRLLWVTEPQGFSHPDTNRREGGGGKKENATRMQSTDTVIFDPFLQRKVPLLAWHSEKQLPEARACQQLLQHPSTKSCCFARD